MKSNTRTPRARPGVQAIALAVALAAGATLAAQPAQAADPDMNALKAEAVTLMQGFGGSLLGELKGAMERGGPVEAIQVCAAKAQPLAQEASRDSGWSIGRTSHRLRNPENAPDAFEQQVLADFLARQDKGEKAADLAHAAVVDDPDGGKTFRFVKAIPTGEPCLACHGTELRPDVAAALDELYPQDIARGFAAGQMRGVFTLSRRL